MSGRVVVRIDYDEKFPSYLFTRTDVQQPNGRDVVEMPRALFARYIRAIREITEVEAAMKSYYPPCALCSTDRGAK